MKSDGNSIYRTATMTDQQIDKRMHKARKKHQCCKCQTPIEKGTLYTKTVGTFDGYFISSTWHKECHVDHVLYVQERERGSFWWEH